MVLQVSDFPSLTHWAWVSRFGRSTHALTHCLPFLTHSGVGHAFRV